MFVVLTVIRVAMDRLQIISICVLWLKVNAPVLLDSSMYLVYEY